MYIFDDENAHQRSLVQFHKLHASDVCRYFKLHITPILGSPKGRFNLKRGTYKSTLFTIACFYPKLLILYLFRII